MVNSKKLLPVEILAIFLILMAGHREAQLPSSGFQTPQFLMPNVTCDQLNCAKGTCKMNSSSTQDSSSSSFSYSYSCQCEQGWLARLGGFIPFAPCTISNCTETNCSTIEQPPTQFQLPENFSDPCSWAFCGGGKCVSTSSYSYVCNCNTGYKNLFNNTIFPCYSDCSLGEECKKLGIGFLNATAETPSTDGSHSRNTEFKGSPGAHSAIPDSFVGVLIVTLPLYLIMV